MIDIKHLNIDLLHNWPAITMNTTIIKTSHPLNPWWARIGQLVGGAVVGTGAAVGHSAVSDSTVRVNVHVGAVSIIDEARGLKIC